MQAFLTFRCFYFVINFKTLQDRCANWVTWKTAVAKVEFKNSWKETKNVIISNYTFPFSGLSGAFMFSCLFFVEMLWFCLTARLHRSGHDTRHSSFEPALNHVYFKMCDYVSLTKTSPTGQPHLVVCVLKFEPRLICTKHDCFL